MRVGRRTPDGALANLRSVLSYLEIGRQLSQRAASEQPAAVPERFDLFALALGRLGGERPLYLEFGVFEGRSLRWWASHLQNPDARFVGFDSFEGLPEAWRPGMDAGHFATGKPPDIADARVSFEIGWFDETLASFTAPEHDRLLINIDSDLYSSAVTVLDWATPLLKPGTLIYFDEFPDRDHEMRALAEYAERSPFSFVPLGFARGGLHWLFEVRQGDQAPSRAG
jgi:predicted O-methyltransferase YrrM